MARGKNKRKRSDGGGISTLAAGAIALVIIVAGSYLGFTKHIPFTQGFRVKAVFASANSIRKNSPVRIAGVNVGKVKDIERYKNSDNSVITLEIDKAGLPLHTDATMKIRPRIFLEGNFFVDVRPGTPNAPTLKDGGTIPVTNTATPVQLDQVLTALQSNTRSDLQSVLDEYGTALAAKPRGNEDQNQAPEVRDLTGAGAIKKTLQYSPSALKNSAIVNEATLGTSPHDLSGIIANLAKVTTSLNTREAELKGFITNFNRTMAATASQAGNLRATLRLLPPTLSNAFRTLGDVNAALPSTRAFARDILPGTRETASTINASFPWIRQTRALLGPAELQGVARELRRTSPSLGTLADSTVRVLPPIDLIDRCVTKVIIPSGNVKVTADGMVSGRENYKEFWYTMVGLASEGQNFDGNGTYVRFQPGGGLNTISTGKAQITGETLVGNYPKTPSGTAPAYPTKPNGAASLPPFRPGYACYKNSPLTSAKVNGPAARGPGDRVVSTQSPSTPALPGLPALPPLPLPKLPGLPQVPPVLRSGKTAGAATAKPARSARRQGPAAAPSTGGTR